MREYAGIVARSFAASSRSTVSSFGPTSGSWGTSRTPTSPSSSPASRRACSAWPGRDRRRRGAVALRADLHRGSRGSGRARGPCEGRKGARRLRHRRRGSIGTDRRSRRRPRTTMRQSLITYASLPFYRSMLERSGFEDDLAAFDEGIGAGDMERATGGLSDRMLEELLCDRLSRGRAGGSEALPRIRRDHPGGRRCARDRLRSDPRDPSPSCCSAPTRPGYATRSSRRDSPVIGKPNPALLDLDGPVLGVLLDLGRHLGALRRVFAAINWLACVQTSSRHCFTSSRPAKSSSGVRLELVARRGSGSSGALDLVDDSVW